MQYLILTYYIQHYRLSRSIPPEAIFARRGCKFRLGVRRLRGRGAGVCAGCGRAARPVAAGISACADLVAAGAAAVDLPCLASIVSFY